MISKKDVLKARSKAEQEEDPLAVRYAMVDKLLQTKFQLTSVGTIFQMGQEADPSYNDILYVLNRLYTTGYAQQFKLMPYGTEPEILASALTKEVVAWLVPIVLQNVDRKVLGGEIDILAPNNHTLVYLCDVMAWYWHKSLHGPKPVVNSMLKMQKTPRQVVQNAVLSCPICYHQFVPPANYKTQESKAWAYSRWLPTHFVEYHKWHKPGTKKESLK